MKNTRQEIIEDLKFYFVNSYITLDNFPYQKPAKGKFLFSNGPATSENVEKNAKNMGYRCATLDELLVFAKEEWNGKDLVVAIGSSAVLFGIRRVPCLDGWGDERRLYLSDYDSRWRGGCRVLLVGKSLDPMPLGTPALGTLDSSASVPSLDAEDVIKELEYVKRRLHGHSNGEKVNLEYVDARIDDLITIINRGDL